jgi:drug/metabolite transporter (DMT)-like permease
VIKIGLHDMPPFLSAGLRFFIAYLALSAYAVKKGLKLPLDKKSHLFFLAFSVINFTSSYALVYWGEQYINSGLTSVLFSVMPFYVALISIKLLPSEKITLVKMLGIFIGFAGVVIVFNDQLNFYGERIWLGMSAILLSPFFSALGTILGKRAREQYNSITLNTFPLLYTSITFFFMYMLWERNAEIHFTPAAIFSILYLAVFGTAIAFALYFWLLKSSSAVSMSLITFITPPLALIWGWLILDERLTINLLLGMAVVFSGIFVIRLKEKTKRRD